MTLLGDLFQHQHREHLFRRLRELDHVSNTVHRSTFIVALRLASLSASNSR